MKRVVVIADLHCGHLVGLTPPENILRKNKDLRQYSIINYDNEFGKVRNHCWDYYASILKKLQPIDLCIANGDLIDGRGEISGGTELIAVDRLAQCEMAIYALKQVNAKNYNLTYGTPYHTGKYEDYENVVANRMSAKIGSHEFIQVNGITFDVKHKVGNSSTPYSKNTPIAKDRLWNVLWEDKGLQPKGDIIIRSHTHTFNYCGDDDYLAMTTPALQGMGSKYGARQCSGIVDFGFVVFDIEEKGEYSWKPNIAKIQEQRATITKY